MVFSPAATDYQHTGCFFNDNGTTTQYTDDTMVAADVFTDAFFRDMIQKLDDNNVPMDGRSLVIPPSVRNTIMGIDRYVSSDFVTGQAVNSGLIGNLYGVDVYVSANCRTIEAAADNTAFLSTLARLFCSTLTLSSWQNSKQFVRRLSTSKYLSTLYTADCLYGVRYTVLKLVSYSQSLSKNQRGA